MIARIASSLTTLILTSPFRLAAQAGLEAPPAAPEPAPAAPPAPTPAPAAPAVADAPAAGDASAPARAPAPQTPAAPPAPQPEKPAARAPAPTQPRKDGASKPWKGFAVASNDGAHQLELRALVHADARFFLDGEEVNSFALRRVRPSLDGKVFEYYEFKFQPDFAASRLQLLDAYANLHFIDEVQLRVGKGKSPVGLERLQSPADISFTERALPTLLVPNRDVGVQIHGQLFEGAIAYAAGIYNGVPNGQSGDGDDNDDKDWVGRVFVLPFANLAIEPLAGLGLGISGLTGMEQGVAASYRSSGQATFFEYAETAAGGGRRNLISPQGYYYYGPVGLMFEYVRVSERIDDTESGASAGLVHDAWQVAGSIVIGGTPSYKGVKVKTPLDPQRGGLGALELGARYTAIALDEKAFRFGLASADASASEAKALGFGLTWHFANRVRALVNYERTTFVNGAAGADRDPEALLVSRMQVAF